MLDPIECALLLFNDPDANELLSQILNVDDKDAAITFKETVTDMFNDKKIPANPQLVESVIDVLNKTFSYLRVVTDPVFKEQMMSEEFEADVTQQIFVNLKDPEIQKMKDAIKVKNIFDEGMSALVSNDFNAAIIHFSDAQKYLKSDDTLFEKIQNKINLSNLLLQVEKNIEAGENEDANVMLLEAKKLTTDSCIFQKLDQALSSAGRQEVSALKLCAEGKMAYDDGEYGEAVNSLKNALSLQHANVDSKTQQLFQKAQKEYHARQLQEQAMKNYFAGEYEAEAKNLEQALQLTVDDDFKKHLERSLIVAQVTIAVVKAQEYVVSAQEFLTQRSYSEMIDCYLKAYDIFLKMQKICPSDHVYQAQFENEVQQLERYSAWKEKAKGVVVRVIDSALRQCANKQQPTADQLKRDDLVRKLTEALLVKLPQFLSIDAEELNNFILQFALQMGPLFNKADFFSSIDVDIKPENYQDNMLIVAFTVLKEIKPFTDPYSDFQESNGLLLTTRPEVSMATQGSIGVLAANSIGSVFQADQLSEGAASTAAVKLTN